ncbi:perlucin-like protein [Cherax quadricarinatus]|uniref:perlucin-like protein n=1 Tax=Cherax quadricarinatus TaxID=27406 RepID=UPI00387E9672
MKCVAALTFVFVFFPAALTATSGQASCPAEYLSFSVDAVTQVCVKFYMYVKGTWASMRALCQAEGADLAELRGDLHDQVYSYIFSHSDLRDEGFWMGGTDEGHEGYWVWISDNSAIPLDWHWWPGQPDGGTNANYACIYTPDFYFHSCDNDIKIYALCQI